MTVMKRSLKGSITFSIIGVLTACLCSCKKNGPVTTNYQVVESDAAAIVADNLLPRYGGLISQLDNCASLSSSALLKCGEQKDSAITKSNQPNATILFNYQLNWRYSYDCSDQTQHYYFTGQSDYEGYNYISSDQRTATITYISLPQHPGFSRCIFNWKSSGRQRVKAIGLNTFNSMVEISASDLTVDLASGEIASGILAVNFYDTKSSNFSFTGKITFLGNNKANLILNSGRNYPLSW